MTSDRDLPFAQRSSEMRNQELEALTSSPWLLIEHILGDDPMLALRSLRWLRRFLDGAEDYWVTRAWDSGRTFMWIGLMLGRSRQAVHMRYRRASTRDGWLGGADDMLRALGRAPEPEIQKKDRAFRFGSGHPPRERLVLPPTERPGTPEIERSGPPAAEGPGTPPAERL